MTDRPPECNQEELVAYLDGEVTDEDRIRIEKRLAEDETYRSRLVELQRAWRMLDRLSTAHADDSFTKSTVAMAAAEARSEGDVAIFRSARRPLKWALLVAATTVGFLAIYVPQKRRERSELRDLPVVHNFEMYRYAEDIEFLKQLADERLFDDEEDDVL